MESVKLINGTGLNNKGDLIPIEIALKDGKISQIENEKNKLVISTDQEEKIVDLNGKLLLPGFIDMHVHLRDPGFTSKENIETGTRAAAKGGFTTIACMPNTFPVIDSLESISSLQNKIKSESKINVFPIPAMTKNLNGVDVANYDEYKRNGIIAITDDGKAVQDDKIMEQVFMCAKKAGLSILQHCEYTHLSNGGAIHEGKVSMERKIKGISPNAESEMIKRDIELAKKTGVHYHVQHISAIESIELVRQAKANNINVTAEVTPHHLILTDEDIVVGNTNFKMSPPLRCSETREKLIEAVNDGTIDIIATDHAPHTTEDKPSDFRKAAFGVVGLETAFPVLYTDLVLKNKISLKKIVDCMTTNVAKIFRLPYGNLEQNSNADLVIIDLHAEKEVNPDHFLSMGKNTPFDQWNLKGWPVMTYVNGNKIWSEI